MAILSIDELREAVLKLDVVQPESLICELVKSLDTPNATTDIDSDEEWTVELLRRSDEVRRGLVQPRDWRESIADLKQQLRESTESWTFALCPRQRKRRCGRPAAMKADSGAGFRVSRMPRLDI